MQIERDTFDRQVGVAQFEEALLENHSENFVAQEFLRSLAAQIDRQRVSRFDLYEFVLRWQRSELEKIE